MYREEVAEKWLEELKRKKQWQMERKIEKAQPRLPKSTLTIRKEK